MRELALRIKWMNLCGIDEIRCKSARLRPQTPPPPPPSYYYFVFPFRVLHSCTREDKIANQKDVAWNIVLMKVMDTAVKLRLVSKEDADEFGVYELALMVSQFKPEPMPPNFPLPDP